VCDKVSPLASIGVTIPVLFFIDLLTVPLSRRLCTVNPNAANRQCSTGTLARVFSLETSRWLSLPDVTGREIWRQSNKHNLHRTWTGVPIHDGFLQGWGQPFDHA